MATARLGGVPGSATITARGDAPVAPNMLSNDLADPLATDPPATDSPATDPLAVNEGR